MGESRAPRAESVAASEGFIASVGAVDDDGDEVRLASKLNRDDVLEEPLGTDDEDAGMDRTSAAVTAVDAVIAAVEETLSDMNFDTLETCDGVDELVAIGETDVDAVEVTEIVEYDD